MKILLNVCSNKDLEINNRVDGYILSVKNFSVNYNYSHTLDEIIALTNKFKSAGKEVFININTNIENKNIDKLKEILVELAKLDINGLIYHDLAVLNLCLKNNLDIILIYGATTYITNYYNVSFYKEVNGVVLSNEIRREEIEEVRKKTNKLLFLNIYGHINMMTTRRQLISNYLTHIKHQADNNHTFFIEDVITNQKYPIIEHDGLCSVYSSKKINIACDDVCASIDYGIISLFNSSYSITEILDGFAEENSNFLDIETIYKVGKA